MKYFELITEYLYSTFSAETATYLWGFLLALLFCTSYFLTYILENLLRKLGWRINSLIAQLFIPICAILVFYSFIRLGTGSSTIWAIGIWIGGGLTIFFGNVLAREKGS